MCTFNVALQLEWGRELTVTVLAGGVTFPAFTALLLKLQVMFHVVHKPLNDSEYVKNPQYLNFHCIYHMQDVQDSSETLLCKDFDLKKN